MDKLYSESITLVNRKEYWKARERLSKILTIDSKHQKAKESLKNINTLLGKRLYFLGKQKEEKKDYRGALKNYIEAQNLIPYNTEIKKAAKRTREKIMRLNQARSQKLYKQGLDKYSEGDIKESIKLWKEALKYDPENLKAKRALERAENEVKRRKKLK